MNKAVEAYVRERREKLEQEKCKRVNALLAREKICDESEKIFAKPGISESAAAYSGFSKREYVDGELRYYKARKKPIEAGMEECKAVEEVLRLEREFEEDVFSDKKSREYNIMPVSQGDMQDATSYAFTIIALIIWIGGFIVSTVLGKDPRGNFSFATFIIYLAGFGFGGLLPFAISKILDYLAIIARNTSGMHMKETRPTPGEDRSAG